MKGPGNAAEAKAWIRNAMGSGRYEPTPHFMRRMLERGATMADVRNVTMRPVRVEPYPDVGLNGGTCWRVIGRGIDSRKRIAVGAEAYRREDQQTVVLVTIFGGVQT